MGVAVENVFLARQGLQRMACYTPTVPEAIVENVFLARQGLQRRFPDRSLYLLLRRKCLFSPSGIATPYFITINR